MSAGDVFKKLRGIIGSSFQFSNGTGPNVIDNSDVIEVKDSASTSFVVVRGAVIPSSGQNINDLVAFLDLRGRVADLEFNFAGASAPAPGSNTSKFGFCHTTGGANTAGQVVYDNGAALVVIPWEVAKHVTSRSAVTGTKSLIANGLYCQESQYNYTLKGDGTPSSSGFTKAIRVDFDKDSTTVNSTTDIPDGATVIRTKVVVTTAFDGTAPVIAVSVDGSSPEALMVNGDSNLLNAGEYQLDDGHDITSSNEGVLELVVDADSSSNGEGYVVVEYATPSA